jgi:hypothetical protein
MRMNIAVMLKTCIQNVDWHLLGVGECSSAFKANIGIAPSHDMPGIFQILHLI